MSINPLLHPLEALTHLDGRNGHKIATLRHYFSEYSWMKRRVEVMTHYLALLLEKRIIPITISRKERIKLLKVASEFSVHDGEKCQEIEKTTNHDLRALEIWLKRHLKTIQLDHLLPYANLGAGSEDINNIAFRKSIYEALHQDLIPTVKNFLKSLIVLTEKGSNQAMLARTHGQPASVTTIGKELALFIDRLTSELTILQSIKLHPKFSGEVGTSNSLVALLPKYNWQKLQKEFVGQFGFSDTAPATQIAPYDDLISLWDSLRRLNQIALALCKDIWLYCSFGYFKIANIAGEAGSSGMPHKVNPIFFEGAEGGFEMANAILELFSRKFSYNRLQRDFSDSTLRRNISLPFALSFLSYQSLVTAVNRLAINEPALSKDLDNHWEVLSETLYTALKLEGNNEAYSFVREELRGKVINQTSWQKILEKAPLSPQRKKLLQKLKPDDLTGYALEITQEILTKVKHTLQSIKARKN